MKGLWLLLPALAGFVSGEIERRSFITSCSEIELDPNRGLLNAFCPSKGSEKADHVSQVDLNGCLGWGPSGKIEDMDLLKHKMVPADGGNFSRHCSSCHIVQRSESRNQVGYILCNCALKDSDVTAEYKFDLKQIVKIDGNGCLECKKAPSVCTQVKKRESPTNSDGELLPQAAASGLLEGHHLSFGPGNKSTVSDCDSFVPWALQYYPNVIPKTYHDGPISPCDSTRGPGLCCYLPRGGYGRGMLGFHLIEDLTHVYRIEYARDQGGNHTVLKAVLRFCKYPDSTDKCPDGEPVEDTEPEPKKPINSTTPVFLKARRESGVLLVKEDTWSLTTSQEFTSLPDIYFPTPTMTSRSSHSVTTAPVSSVQSDPDLKIDLGHLDAAGLVTIMLGATNIDEVKHARLSLKVSTDCFTNKDGIVECQKVVVGMEGHRLTNNTLVKNTATTITTQSAVNSATLATTLLKRLDTPLPHLASLIPQPPRFDDGAQAVLGPMPRNQDHADASGLVTDIEGQPDQAQAHAVYVGSFKHSQSLGVDNKVSSTQIVTRTVTYFPEEEQDLTQGDDRHSPATTSGEHCGLMGCP